MERLHGEGSLTPEEIEIEVSVFLNENPDIISGLGIALRGLSAVIAIGTIIEDVYTGGLGVLDDAICFRVSYLLWNAVK